MVSNFQPFSHMTVATTSILPVLVRKDEGGSGGDDLSLLKKVGIPEKANSSRQLSGDSSSAWLLREPWP